VEQQLDRYEQAALDVVREVTRELVAAGRAEVRLRPCKRAHVGNLGDFLIELVPTNPRACPISILASDQQIDLWLGQDGVLDEISQKSHEERLNELRLRVAAVVAGGYEEHWHQVRRPWPFRSTITQLVGRFRTEEGERDFAHQGCEPEGLELERQSWAI
jgi:hypothetical protein